MSIEKPPEPWLSFLNEIDDLAAGEAHFHCLGGFVVTQMYGSARSTSDVDFLSHLMRNNVLTDHAGKGSRLHERYGIYLDPVGVAQVPENYEDRLVEMYPGVFKNLRLFALDAYDLALAKIERNIERDRDDVKHLARAVPFDLEVLKSRYNDELRVYLGNPQREDLTLKLWIEMIEEGRR